MEGSYKYFKNTSCKYFPCHKGMKTDDFNCLFCYCPMNSYEDCLGKPEYIVAKSGKRVKSCMNCTFPHEPEHYEKIIQFLSEKMK